MKQGLEGQTTAQRQGDITDTSNGYCSQHFFSV